MVFFIVFCFSMTECGSRKECQNEHSNMEMGESSSNNQTAPRPSCSPRSPEGGSNKGEIITDCNVDSIENTPIKSTYLAVKKRSANPLGTPQNGAQKLALKQQQQQQEWPIFESFLANNTIKTTFRRRSMKWNANIIVAFRRVFFNPKWLKNPPFFKLPNSLKGPSLLYFGIIIRIENKFEVYF